MRRHASVLMLLSRGTIYRVLLLCAALAGAEVLLFSRALGRALAETSTGLEQVFADSGAVWVFGACFLLMIALLSAAGCEFGGRQGYTLRRLRVTEKSVFFSQAGYNAFCCLLLWAAQMFTALALCGLYLTRAAPEAVSGQTVFLAFYRSSFLHSLLPLSEGSRWVRNLALVLGLGICSAGFAYWQRRKKVSFLIFALTAAALFFFQRELGRFDLDGLLILLCTGLSVRMICAVLSEGEYDEA